MEKVVIIGASSKEDRYAYKAQKLLMEYGHEVFPVSPTAKNVLEVKGYDSLEEIQEPIDTITLYINPRRLAPMLESIIRINPKRVIFNLGTEDPNIETELERNGIQALRACTLVMLNTGQY
ncbi:MAG: CoA-binding protein [Lentisphaeria bacterium]|nr:CoA-binding protein [Lentisphaeria bacterium]